VALGETVGKAIVAAAKAEPVAVRVQVPAGAEFLAFRPWELAHVSGVPLAARGDVALVYELPGQYGPPVGAKAEVVGALRMLAVFSLPTETSTLGLRRERYELTRLVRRVAARGRRRVDLRVMQYGVTRQVLADVAEDGGGWDVLHLSGHGRAGELLLEKADGSPDRVSTAELVGLLRPLRARVKLAVVSACQSAAATTAGTLRWLGLTDPAEQLEAQASQEAASGTPASAGVARAVQQELACAVVAMRYPVVDDFAVAFGDAFYDRVFRQAQPLHRALPGAVAAAAGSTPSAGRPAVSVATPALFGATAVGLSLAPPVGPAAAEDLRTPLAAFPPEPERFVGRAAVMAAASAALAPESGRTGVVLHGMAGAGKTAAAVELAYRHARVFEAHAFWAAPTDPDQFGDALRLLALALETQLNDWGVAMVDKIATPEALAGFLPRLRALLRERGLLLVLDNLETLLTPDGRWRDPRWKPLLTALVGHGGDSRLILTSRVAPAELDPIAVLVRPVHALSRDESLPRTRPRTRPRPAPGRPRRHRHPRPHRRTRAGPMTNLAGPPWRRSSIALPASLQPPDPSRRRTDRSTANVSGRPRAPGSRPHRRLPPGTRHGRRAARPGAPLRASQRPDTQLRVGGPSSREDTATVPCPSTPTRSLIQAATLLRAISGFGGTVAPAPAAGSAAVPGTAAAPPPHPPVRPFLTTRV
jgi:hypothetical protein